ncbi:MAG: ABC transporter permease [Candidatus Izemoplasmataceae bacterium]
MKKFKFLLLFGLKKRVAKKSFIITNAILGLVIMAVINIPALIEIFGDEDEATTHETRIVNETDQADYPLEDAMIDTLNAGAEPVYEKADTELESHDDFWDNDAIDVLLVFSGDLGQPDVEIYTKDDSLDATITSRVQSFLNEYQGINYGNFSIMEAPDSDEEEGMDEATQSFIQGIGSLLILPVFILIIMATQFLGVDIIEEKSSKAIETIISSVPAKVHFLSKILYNILFLVIQTSILILFGILGVLVGRLLAESPDIEALSLLGELAERMPNWPGVLTMTLFFLVFGTLFFLTLAALIAAVATTQEDYQQFQAPIIFLILGGYYIAIFLPMLGFETIVKVASFIPFFSTLVAPIAYASGILSLFEVLLSALILIVSVILFMYIISPVYRVAILSYEETKFIKRIKSYFKKAFSR